jgi:ABC-type bacteriocin/lantibiotic exporter with double-glycine peptidase domain
MIRVKDEILLILSKFNSNKKIFIISILIFIGVCLEIFGLGLLYSSLNFLFSDKETVNFLGITVGKNFKALIVSLIMLVFLIKTLMQVLITYKQNEFIAYINHKITSIMVSKYLQKDYSFFIDNKESYLLKNMQEETVNAGVYIYSCIIIITESIFLFCLFSFLLVNEPLLTFVTIFLFLFVGLIFFNLSHKKLNKLSFDREIVASKVSSKLIDFFYGIKTIKISNIEKSIIKDLGIDLKSKFNISSIQNTLNQTPRYFLELMLLVSIGVIVALVNLTDNNENMIQVLGIFAAAGTRIIPSINKIISNSQNLSYYENSLRIITNTIREVNSTKRNLDLKIINNISLSKVCFNYQDKRVLRNLDLLIESGDFFGITGESGVGKTTLLNILAGISSPLKGEIIFNRNIKVTDEVSWFNSIGYVDQKGFLFESSIKENIILENEYDESFYNEIIDNLRIDFKTVGKNKDAFSGGQIKKILLARELYKKPQMLLLDETTSSLDDKNEDFILQYIQKLNIENNMIVVMVTHTKKNLKYCNKKIELK